DAEEATATSYCIHQIRTMLQLTGAGSRQKVYDMTSAVAGEGRRSLTLSLRMSFARSVPRTLLIDADLTARGLTRHLDLGQPAPRPRQTRSGWSSAAGRAAHGSARPWTSSARWEHESRGWWSTVPRPPIFTTRPRAARCVPRARASSESCRWVRPSRRAG